MKISVITVVYNNKNYLEDSILSVKEQSHDDIEHIIIDGGSTDGSLEIIKKYDKYISKWISEPDSGIYDAMNKGVSLATGDIVGFLNSDDIYYSKDILSKISKTIKDNDTDSCYGDIVYVSKDLKKRIRFWRAGEYSDGIVKNGWMPPHTVFFAKRRLFIKHGMFNTKYKISADYDLMLRFLNKTFFSTFYIPELLLKMRIGGKSNKNLFNIIRANIECYRILEINGYKFPFLIIMKKLFRKTKQLKIFTGFL